jgi:hypothetical protein
LRAEEEEAGWAIAAEAIDNNATKQPIEMTGLQATRRSRFFSPLAQSGDDDFGAWLEMRRGRLPADFELEF